MYTIRWCCVYISLYRHLWGFIFIIKLLKVSIYIEEKSVVSGDTTYKSFSIILRHERNRRLTINYRYQVRRVCPFDGGRLKNGTRRETWARKEGRKERRKAGWKNGGENFARVAGEKRGGRKGERIGREGRQKFLVVPEKRPGIMCTHRCNFISLSLSLSLFRERTEVPRLEKTWRGRKFGIFVPAFFTFLSCCARVVPAILMPDDESLSFSFSLSLSLSTKRWNSRLACMPREQWGCALHGESWNVSRRIKGTGRGCWD